MTSADGYLTDPAGNGEDVSPLLPDRDHYRFLKFIQIPFRTDSAPSGLRDYLIEGRRVRFVLQPPASNGVRTIRVECHQGPFRGKAIGLFSGAVAAKWASRMENGCSFAGWIGPEGRTASRIRIAVYERIIFPLDDLSAFEFRHGGFFRPFISVELSFREKTMVYRKSSEPEEGPTHQVSIRFYDKKWDTFVLPALRRCNFLAWRNEYVDPCVCDGVSWTMDLHLRSGKPRHIIGSNDFPEEWEYLHTFLDQCLDMRDLKGSGTFSILPPASSGFPL